MKPFTVRFFDWLFGLARVLSVFRVVRTRLLPRLCPGFAADADANDALIEAYSLIGVALAILAVVVYPMFHATAQTAIRALG